MAAESLSDPTDTWSLLAIGGLVQHFVQRPQEALPSQVQLTAVYLHARDELVSSWFSPVSGVGHFETIHKRGSAHALHVDPDEIKHQAKKRAQASCGPGSIADRPANTLRARASPAVRNSAKPTRAI